MRVPFALLGIALVLAGCAAPGGPPPGPGPGGPPAPTALAMTWGRPVDLDWVGYEPSLAVDPQGVLYMTAHKVLDRPETWPYAGSFFELSRDGGATWEFPANPGGLPLPAHQAYAGAEGDIAVDARGWVYYLDTYLGDNHLHVWSDGGRTWQSSAPAMRTSGVDDRPWIAAQGEGIVHYLGNNGAPVAGGRHWYYRSTDGGLTFGPGLAVPGNGWAHLDAERAGQNVYVVQEDPAAPNGPGELRAMASGDAGQSWSEPVVIHTREGPGREYPVVSAADDGLAWVVTNDCGSDENCADAGGAQEPNRLWLSRTTDAGATWEVFNLTLPEGVFADYPWVAAGPNGTVSVVFYGAATPVTERSEWFLYAAMARPGREGPPDLRFERPTDMVLYTGRDLHALHDFFENAIGPDEVLHIAYMTAEDSDAPETPAGKVPDYGPRAVWYVNARVQH